MESTTTRKERIRLIHRINDVVERYRGACLTETDFDDLWELDVDQLADVQHSMLKQAREMKQYSKH